MLTSIVGTNWGDEGKGRMVDLLSEEYDIVVRYQGGNNAGHTVVNDRGLIGKEPDQEPTLDRISIKLSFPTELNLSIKL